MGNGNYRISIVYLTEKSESFDTKLDNQLLNEIYNSHYYDLRKDIAEPDEFSDDPVDYGEPTPTKWYVSFKNHDDFSNPLSFLR